MWKLIGGGFSCVHDYLCVGWVCMYIMYVCLCIYVCVCQKSTLLAKIFSDRAFLPSWAPWTSAEITTTPQAPSASHICCGCDWRSSCPDSTHVLDWIISSILEDSGSKTLQYLSVKAFLYLSFLIFNQCLFSNF